MSADERKTEILAAEEAIRQLAAEMTRTSESRALAEQASQALITAREELGTVAHQLQNDSRVQEETLRQVNGRLEETRAQVAQAAADMEKAVRQVEKLASGLLDTVKQELARGREESRATCPTIQRLAWATLSVALITLVVGLLVLLKIR